jgi:hypothetical protein
VRTRLGWLLAVTAAATTTALLFGAGIAAATNYNVYCPSGDLQGAIDGAGSGDTITIYGTCYGSFGVNGKDLTLQGGSSFAALNGRQSGTPLSMTDSVVTIRNLSIVNGSSSDGGGLYVYDSSLTMTNVTVKGNRADFGGGIWAYESELDLTGVTVTANRASYSGGGIYLARTTMSLTASMVSRNETTEAAQRYGGGGIWLQDANALITSTRVTANRSGDYGGGIANYGNCQLVRAPPANQQFPLCNGDAGTASGALRAAPSIVSTGLTLVSSSVDHNTAADDGGGIYNDSSEGDAALVLQGTTVSFNNAVGGDGGGIANYGECGFVASVLATGSTFQGNQARAGEGGAVYNASGDFVCDPGTALVTVAQSPTATGPNVVNANQAMYGGGFANVQSDGVASLTLQPGATVRGNKASATGGGVWNNCGSFSSLGQIFLNTPNNVVNTCLA